MTPYLAQLLYAQFEGGAGYLREGLGDYDVVTLFFLVSDKWSVQLYYCQEIVTSNRATNFEGEKVVHFLH